jgi:hypothetical protein
MLAAQQRLISQEPRRLTELLDAAAAPQSQSGSGLCLELLNGESSMQRRLIILLISLLVFGGSYLLLGAPEIRAALPGWEDFSALIYKLRHSADPAPVSASEDQIPVLIGMYTSDSLQVTNWELENFDEWMDAHGVNRRISIAGTFMDIEYLNPDWNIHQELDSAWDMGYTPFVNLTAYQQKAYQVASDPAVEERIRWWASAYAAWTEGGKKRAFIAPLQEMNGGWVRYGKDPEGFKDAWLKIRKIFDEEGVPPESVSWVFAPNGWSEEGHEFERYYPGDPWVDVLAFSTLNFGSCPEYHGNWDTFELIFEPYLDRLHVMAPGKPIFLAQTGTVAVTEHGIDDNLKDEWLRDTFAKLAAYPGVRAILYYNQVKPEPAVTKCRPIDWRVFDKHAGIGYRGFLDAVRSPSYGTWGQDNPDMIETAFALSPTGTFADVWPVEPFSDQENPWYLPYVEALAQAGLAPGCRSESFDVMGEIELLHYFCPEREVTRAEVAFFIELALHGAGYVPPAATGIFSDVPVEHWAAGWIEGMVADGITSGCTEGAFCPDDPVTRAQAAVFIGRIVHGVGADDLPQPVGIFNDVPIDYWGAAWIEQMALDGISSGCGEWQFCPEATITRADLAVFLARAIGLEIIPPQS